MKTYRVYRAVNAKSKEDAVMKIAEEIDKRQFDLTGMFVVQENPFTNGDESTILELARVALSDAEVYDYFADKLDMSDDELKTLQKKIERMTNG